MQLARKPRSVAASAITALLAAGPTAVAQKAAADYEKCAGIAAAGKNDCGTSVSSCAGTAKQDRDPHAWVRYPRELA
jgi:uncharacterized membrane protein